MDREEEGESSSNWSHIGDGILGLVLQRLCLSDYLRLRAVCWSWRTTVDKAIEGKRCPPSPELPLLLLQPNDRIKDHFFLHSLSARRLYKFVDTTDVSNHQPCHGTVQGWMIQSENSHDVSNLQRSIFFVNPMTNSSVLVPGRLNCPAPIRKIVASSNPTDLACVVVCLFNDYSNMAFCGICEKSWTPIEGDKDAGITFLEVEILDGKLYAITHTLLSSLLVYDLRQRKPLKPKILAKLPAIRPAPVITTIGNIHYSYGNNIIYLAVDASCGELLLIYVLTNVVYDRNSVDQMNILQEYAFPPQITAFQVFKWDNEGRWVEVHNLGNRLLFLSTLKSFVVSSVDLDGPKELVRENCIFVAVVFTCVQGTYKWQDMQTRRHCFTDGGMEYFRIPKSVSFVTVPVPTWFIPNAW